MFALYSSEENRLKSFRTWPHTTSKTATPPKLAQAGFFHNPTPENPDRCTCFMCGTSLVSWDVTDIPLEEHKKHAKHCEFLQQLAKYSATTISICSQDPDEHQESPFSCVTRSIIETMCDSNPSPRPAGDAPAGPPPNLVNHLRGGVVRDLLFGPLFEGGDGDWQCGDIALR
eukprot:EG_transcript_18602